MERATKVDDGVTGVDDGMLVNTRLWWGAVANGGVCGIVACGAGAGGIGGIAAADDEVVADMYVVVTVDKTISGRCCCFNCINVDLLLFLIVVVGNVDDVDIPVADVDVDEGNGVDVGVAATIALVVIVLWVLVLEC